MGPGMKAFMDEIAASYAKIMERKSGVLFDDLTVRDRDGFDISRAEENGLCDLAADAFRSIGGTQTAILSAGSVRNNPEAGIVTCNSILNILPYANDIVTAKMTGQMIPDALEYGVSDLPVKAARFPQIAGITFRGNREMRGNVRGDDRNQFVSVEGEHRVSDVMIGNDTLNPKAE